MTPLPGKEAPIFSVEVLTPERKFEQRSLENYTGFLVLVFYPADFTFVCPTEIDAFSTAVPLFASSNTTILMGSTDSVYCHYAFALQLRKTYGRPLRLELFSDEAHELSNAYGVLNSGTGRCHRAIFIIDDKRIVRSVVINGDDVARSVDECLRLVRGFEAVDRTGRVVPCGIKDDIDDDELDKQTISANIDDAQEWIMSNFE